jgi:hypothetical protein
MVEERVVDTKVECPSCGTTFEVGEALANHYRQDAEEQACRATAAAEQGIRADERRRAEEAAGLERADLTRRAEEAEEQLTNAKQAELELRSRERDIGRREQEVVLEIARGRAEAERQIRADERRRAEEAAGLERADLTRRAEEAEEQLTNAKQAELELRSRERDIERREQEIVLEITRGRDALKTELEHQHREDFEARERELEAKNQRLEERLQDALRKNRAGSPQDQGPIRQEIFAELLAEAFPSDEVSNVRQGKAGADVHQVIIDSEAVGMILWEYKSGTKWDAKWVSKLDNDRRKARADIGIIVTSAPPPQGPGLHQIGDAWVVDPEHAVLAAQLFRHLIVRVHTQAQIGEGRDDAAGRLYDFVHSQSFVDGLARILQTTTLQQQELDAERSSLVGHWERRQRTIHQSTEALARLVVGLEGSGAMLPESVHVPLPAGTTQLVAPSAAPSLGRRKKELPSGPTLPGLAITEIRTISIECRACGGEFLTEPRRGRRPVLCPRCREARSNSQTA